MDTLGSYHITGPRHFFSSSEVLSRNDFTVSGNSMAIKTLTSSLFVRSHPLLSVPKIVAHGSDNPTAQRLFTLKRQNSAAGSFKAARRHHTSWALPRKASAPPDRLSKLADALFVSRMRGQPHRYRRFSLSWTSYPTAEPPQRDRTRQRPCRAGRCDLPLIHGHGCTAT